MLHDLRDRNLRKELTTTMMRPRTRLVALHPVHGYPIPPPQDVKVSRRNARERNRVKSVNNGFEVLKKHIPTAAPVKKLSKVGILSHAVDYIRNLQMMLNDGELEEPTDSKSMPATLIKTEPSIEYIQRHLPQPTTLPSSTSPGYSEAQQSPVYPPPLTPISPNTMYYPTPQATYYTTTVPNRAGYESGYDSALGLYSDTEYMLPQPLKQQQGIISPHHHSMPSPADSTTMSLKTSSTSMTYALPPSKRTKLDPDSSGEEDDLLDAIVEWQQSEL